MNVLGIEFDPKSWPTQPGPETLGIIRDLMEQAHSLGLEAALATEEPEYEYRLAWEDGIPAWPFGWDEEEGETLEAVQRVPEEDEEPEYFRGPHIERRTKAIPAGPWEEVET